MNYQKDPHIEITVSNESYRSKPTSQEIALAVENLKHGWVRKTTHATLTDLINYIETGRILYPTQCFKGSPIEAIVLKKLSDIIFDEKTVPLLVDRYNEYVRTKNVETAHQLEVNSAEVKKCVRDINHIVELLMDVQSPTLKEKLRELEIKKALLEANSDELKKKLDSLSIDEKRLKVLFKEAKKMLEEGTLKNKKLLIDKYVKCVTVYKDRIVIELNIAEIFTLKNNVERT